jgi:hypothetical protein
MRHIKKAKRKSLKTQICVLQVLQPNELPVDDRVVTESTTGSLVLSGVILLLDDNTPYHYRYFNSI